MLLVLQNTTVLVPSPVPSPDETSDQGGKVPRARGIGGSGRNLGEDLGEIIPFVTQLFRLVSDIFLRFTQKYGYHVVGLCVFVVAWRILL